MTAEPSAEASNEVGAQILAENITRRKGGDKAGNSLRDFAPKQEKAAEEELRGRSTKEEMLGCDLTPFTRTRDTDDTEVTFFPRPPKLGALPDLIYEVSVASLDAASQVGLVLHLATTFLYVQDAERGHKRRATVQEIAQCLDYADMDMLSEMCSRFTGLTMEKLSPAKK